MTLESGLEQVLLPLKEKSKKKKVIQSLLENSKTLENKIVLQK